MADVSVPFKELPPHLKLNELHRQLNVIMASNEEILAAATAIKLAEEAEVTVIQQIIEKEQQLDATLVALKEQVEQLNTDALPQDQRTQLNDLLASATTQSSQNTAALQALVTPPAP